MIYQDFIRLPVEQKLEIVWHCGTFISSLQSGNYKLELYAIGSFFVEMGLTTSGGMIEDHFLVFTRAFRGIRGLDPYLENIRSFREMKTL